MARNFIHIEGNAGEDVKLVNLESGKKVVEFSVAESVRTSKKDEAGKAIYETRWHQVKAWDGTASFLAKHCKKGTVVSVKGFLDYDDYTYEGKTFKMPKIVTDEVNLYERFKYSNTSNSNDLNYSYEDAPLN